MNYYSVFSCQTLVVEQLGIVKLFSPRHQSIDLLSEWMLDCSKPPEIANSVKELKNNFSCQTFEVVEPLGIEQFRLWDTKA